MAGTYYFLISFILIFNINFEENPSWESVSGFYSTGGDVGDLNNDGWFDLFVGNGNDMEEEPNHVYLNYGGSFYVNPYWQSGDYAPTGHIYVSDFNKDGWVDMAVANYLLAPFNGEWNKGCVYYNTGGNLELYPSWQSGDTFISFSVAGGDFDKDGYLDLAFACGESYSNVSLKLRIYKNYGDSFSSYPVWESWHSYCAYDVAFADIDKNGFLDLIVGNDGRNMVFYNWGFQLDSVPLWISSDSFLTLQIAVGDVDNDGWLDLVVADNAQMYGISKIRIYKNNSGFFDTLPYWESGDNKQYYSTVALADLDGDGDLDIVAGGWWEEVCIFENLGRGNFTDTPVWSWQPPNASDLVCEKIVLADIDKDGIKNAIDTMIVSCPLRTIISLKHIPIFEIDSVKVNGFKVDSFTWDREIGWLIPYYDFSGGETITVYYKYSTDVDIIVTNWEESRGNFLFKNLHDDLYVKERKLVDCYKNEKILSSSISNGYLFFKNKLSGTIKIFSLTGQLIYTTKIKETKKFKLPNFLKPGIYILKYKKTSQKFVLKY